MDYRVLAEEAQRFEQLRREPFDQAQRDSAESVVLQEIIKVDAEKLEGYALRHEIEGGGVTMCFRKTK